MFGFLGVSGERVGGKVGDGKGRGEDVRGERVGFEKGKMGLDGYF